MRWFLGLRAVVYSHFIASNVSLQVVISRILSGILGSGSTVSVQVTGVKCSTRPRNAELCGFNAVCEGDSDITGLGLNGDNLPGVKGLGSLPIYLESLTFSHS